MRVKTYKGLKYLLNREMKRGRLLDVTNIPRGIGKSKLLLEIALENDYVIITNLKAVAMALSKEFNVKYGDIYISARQVDCLRGRNFKGVLLEEGLTVKQEKQLKKLFNVVGGYSNHK